MRKFEYKLEVICAGHGTADEGRVEEMLDEEMDVNSKVSMAMILLSYSNLACDEVRGSLAVMRADPLIDHPDLSPFNKLWWHLRKGHFLNHEFENPEWAKWTDALVRKLVHAPGSPCVARRLWPDA